MKLFQLNKLQIQPRDWSFAFSFGAFEFSLGDGVSFGPAAAATAATAATVVPAGSLTPALRFAPGDQKIWNIGILGEDDGGFGTIIVFFYVRWPFWGNTNEFQTHPSIASK